MGGSIFFPVSNIIVLSSCVCHKGVNEINVSSLESYKCYDQVTNKTLVKYYSMELFAKSDCLINVEGKQVQSCKMGIYDSQRKIERFIKGLMVRDM